MGEFPLTPLYPAKRVTFPDSSSDRGWERPAAHPKLRRPSTVQFGTPPAVAHPLTRLLFFIEQVRIHNDV
jgi:hypothetical protein